MSDTIETADAFGYDQDFYAWTQTQAAALRAAALGGANLPVDWENVAEEIESLGKSQASALRSRLATIIEHLLKLEFWPTQKPTFGWPKCASRWQFGQTAIAFRTVSSPPLDRGVRW